ncbi:MAG: Ldh family oxidoreductase [Proteobacteria bacterium]|nr:Ldh family oxidoreductase [Pseudomonadota bacterium]
MSDVVLSLAEAEQLVAAALQACRTAPDTAGLVARLLVAAEADGLKGHGLSRVPSYAAQARVGKIDGFARPRLEQATPALARIDAAHGFAYPALELATDALSTMAPTMGIAAAAIRRSHHCGVAGHHVEKLAARGLVALLFANTPAAMAPWGGRTGVFGTNPIAFACPLPDEPPIVVDLSLSKVARGNILNAQQRGVPIPEGWALDKDGQPTTDPSAALAGTMLPIGDAKGTALALMVELLAAGLTGASYAADATSFLDDKGGPPDTGQLLIALDPLRVGGAGTVAHFARLAGQITGQDGARLPGLRRIGLRRKAAETGLAVPEKLVRDIRALAGI